MTTKSKSKTNGAALAAPSENVNTTTLTIDFSKLTLDYEYCKGFTFDPKQFVSPEAMEKTLQACLLHGVRRKINDEINSSIGKAFRLKNGEAAFLQARKKYFQELLQQAYAGEFTNKSGSKQRKIIITPELVQELLVKNSLEDTEENRSRVERKLIATGKYAYPADELELDIEL